jgi:hypothetical protein
MPHGFKPYPKHPAVAYLIRLHADIGGRILENKRQAERLAADAKAVELVIQMFDPAFNARTIAARRRVVGNPWFKRGTLYRSAIDVLRTAASPMTVAEIVSDMLIDKGIRDATAKQIDKLCAGVRASLENHAGKTVDRVGEGLPMRWRLR